MSDHVTNNVYKLRRDRGITQEELARTLGITRQTIIAIERGNYTPSVLLALKISKYFKHPTDDIFKLTHEK